MKSQGDMKTPHHSVSGRSYLASTPDSSNVAVYEVGKDMKKNVIPDFKWFQNFEV